LVFLKSRQLVELVSTLHEYASAADALEAQLLPSQRASYERALARLARSGVIHAV
jgi:putative mycofactocin binding protein MftB